MSGPWEKYQGNSKPAQGNGPWAKYAQQNKAPEPIEPAGREGAAALEGLGEGISLGYLNNIQAATEKPVFALLNKLTGQNVEADDYLTARDSYNKRQADLKQENPKSFMTGQVAGTILSSAPVAGAGTAATVGGRALQSAKAGALYGAAQNTSEQEGELGDLNIAERIENAGMGAAAGAAGSAAGDGLGVAAKYGANKVSQARNAAGENLKNLAETQAFKSMGAMLKDFRNSSSKNEINEIGRYLLDKGIVKVGDSVDDIAAKAMTYKKEAGQLLDKVYSDADAALQTSISQKAFDPIRDKERILKAAKDELGDTVGANAAIEKLSNYIDDVAQKNIDDAMADAPALPINNPTMSPRRANDIKGALDEQINYARNPLSKEPAAEKAFTGARREVNKIVSESIDDLGGSQATQGLKDANKQYGLATKTNQIAQDRVNREAANKMFGLTDTITAGASAGYGAVTGDWETAIAAMAAKKGFEKYGTTGIARLADAASKRLLQQPKMAQLANANPQAFKATVFSLLERIPAQGEATILKRVADNGEEKTASIKGPEKWAADGAKNLIAAGVSQDQINELMKSEKGKSLLYEAQDAKTSDSRRMKSILQKIRMGQMNTQESEG